MIQTPTVFDHLDSFIKWGAHDRGETNCKPKFISIP